MKIDHAFYSAGPLCWCGAPKSAHRERVYHDPDGDPCTKCGLRASAHGSEKTRENRKARDKKRFSEIDKCRAIIGVDGEGHDLPDGRHIYTLLSAVDEEGNVVAEVENPEGLSTLECVEMIQSLPKNALKFIFMGSYDWTKMIEDLELVDVWYIMHPEARRVRSCKTCKKTWSRTDTQCPSCGHEECRSVQRLRKVDKDKHDRALGASFDWFNGSFTVSRSYPRGAEGARGERSIKVWDCFKFFQCSFVKAIKLWKIGTPEQHARIEGMKAKRGAFDVEDPVDVRNYCREECQLLAMMMREVLNACEGAGIKLTQYHGAGSIASALMKANNVKEHLGPPLESFPKSLQHAVMSAYFGGRFENSVVGFVTEPVYNRDIFSAYPYALSQLPCLTCGQWKHIITSHNNRASPLGVLKKARKATLAVVRFKVKEQNDVMRKTMAWAPLPCRLEEGSITFPTGFEGWAWLPELEAALRGWPDLIEVLECWTYTMKCEHKPFAWIPDAYRKRFQWGKDGRGIVMKLGLNACAGKTMQNQGDPPPFKSWILGGMITATTRSQSLDAICAAKNRWNVLGIATDGVFSTENLELPNARSTGTSDLEKPLGNWGSETHDDGVFFVKPGMYFDEAGKIMRARGIGRVELNKHARQLIEKFEGWDRKSKLQITVQSRRFYGARSSVLLYSHCMLCNTSWPGAPEQGCPKCGEPGTCRAQTMKLPDGKTDAYGRWFPRTIVIEFASFPKREAISDGGDFGKMRIRDMGGITSLPYDPGKTTPEGEASRLAQLEALEEPDWIDNDMEIA